MKEIYIKSARKIIQNKEELEKKLKVKISVKGTNTIISGNEIEEFFAEKVLLALDFPFSIEEALLLLNENYMFNVVHIKEHTRRHDLDVIRSRIIGTKGKALSVLQDLTNSLIVLKGNDVAIISSVENFENALQGVISLIRGSKHGNVYSYLEKSHKRN